MDNLLICIELQRKIKKSDICRILNKQAQILQTGDGSTTVFLPELNETYHSRHGAVQESNYVFIEQGLLQRKEKALNILEIGFGTGLNALLTLNTSIQKSLSVYYHTLEPYPLGEDIWHQLDFGHTLAPFQSRLQALHKAPWNQNVVLDTSFTLLKDHTKLQDFKAETRYDLIYFDAFAPSRQSEMWTEANMQIMFDCLNKQSLLVTYCASGQFKRHLKQVGFEVETLPGPPGKREMTRAWKP